MNCYKRILNIRKGAIFLDIADTEECDLPRKILYNNIYLLYNNVI